MSTLMVCRQIKKIQIDNGTATIFADDDTSLDLMTNDKHKREIGEFFNSRDLSYRIFENKKDNTLEDLRNVFGDKLKLK